MTRKFIDLFCGAGGASTGMVAAGHTAELALDRLEIALQTHAMNHPGCTHVHADAAGYRWDTLPDADIIWASPICTEVSLAGGRTHTLGPRAATGITFSAVVDAARAVRPDAVIVENVPEVTRWDGLARWQSEMSDLGYHAQWLSANSAHVAGEVHGQAPQWRDRALCVWIRGACRMPVIEPRPAAWCDGCQVVVSAVQRWRSPDAVRIGRFRRQYFYACPVCLLRVEPRVVPAADAIDWSDRGQRIGDRSRPLAPGTMRRIQEGLDMIADGRIGPRFLMATHHTSGRHSDPMTSPHATVTGRNGTGLVMMTHGFRSVSDQGMIRSCQDPMPTVRASGQHALILPFARGGGITDPDDGPISTLTTRAKHTVMTPAARIEDVRFRMLSPGEAAAAQRFPSGYQWAGNQGQRQLQAGNAVSVNVAEWVGRQISEVLDG